MNQGSDNELIDRFLQAEDLVALDHLFERHIQRVRNIIGPMVRNESDADDLTQQVFLRAARGLPAFNRQAKFTSWLHRIALNTTYTFLERRKRRSDLPLEIDPKAPPHRRPDRHLASAEALSTIEQAVAALPAKLQAALVMMVIEGLPATEAAQAEGVTVATMHWRVHKARSVLRDALSENDSGWAAAE